MPPIQVPEKFNRNSPTVVSLMPPEQSGRWLLQRMQQHLGIEDYATRSLLDFGCGVRFTQAILSLGLPLAQYVGVDCDREMIDFLATAVKDRRFSYHLLDAQHPFYNPRGSVRLGPDIRLPIPEHHFDVVAMFSVLTHQCPDDARHLLAMLRRHVHREGRLFFTCFLDDTIETFEDRSPERNGGRCCYNAAFLADIVHRAGWQTLARHPAEAPLIGDSFVCRPAGAA
jgi:SAM-dependent methyltransferase